MTQGQLACALYPNLDPEDAEKRKGDISKLENGRVHNPMTQTVRALATALGISEEEIDALHRRVQMSAREQLDNLPALDRDALELLAGRFGIARVHSMSDRAIREELTKRAEDWRNLRAEVDAIPDTYRKLTNLKAAAQEAIDRVDPDEVENLLSQVHYTELDEAARSAELRANNALVRGDIEAAYRLLNSAANSFEAVDALEPVRRKLRYEEVFHSHGLRYGGTGIAFSERMIRDALNAFSETDEPLLWSQAHNALAVALQSQGIRTDGSEGATLLAEAVDSYRAAPRVRTEDAHPVQWAQTMQNLGNSLQIQGTRTGGPEGARLLSEAVDSYRAALRVRTQDAHPVKWAMTIQNLASALDEQGARTAGLEGATLLAEAVDSYRAALRVRTQDAHPVQWAMTQENMAMAEQAWAAHDTTIDPHPHLEAALEHVDAALTVFDPEHMPYNFEKATKLRDEIVAQIADLP